MTMLRSTCAPLDAGLAAEIAAILDADHLMALATVRPDGYPQTTWVNYIRDGFTFYFATDAAAQKIGNIALFEKVSGTIAVERKNFYKLKGLSFGGIARRITDHARAESIALDLFRHIPQSRRFVPRDARDLAVVEVVPKVISIIDYSKGFGTATLVTVG